MNTSHTSCTAADSLEAKAHQSASSTSSKLNAKVMRALRAEDAHLRKQDKRSTNQRSKSAADRYEAGLRKQLGRGHPDLIWNPKRARDITDFQYLFLHRERFPDHIQTALEIIAAKITHVKDDGEEGYHRGPAAAGTRTRER